MAQKKIYPWYLYLAIGFSLLYLVSTLLSFLLQEDSIFLLLMSSMVIVISLFWIILNIIMIFIIIIKKIERAALWIPLLYLGSAIFLMIFGFVAGLALSDTYDLEWITTLTFSIGVAVGSVIQITILCISLKLLKN